jgi:hypothetical protein
MHEHIYQEYKAINRNIDLCRRKLIKFPEGRIECFNNGGYVKWYRIGPSGREYICKKDRKLAAGLAAKKFCELQLTALEEEKSMLEDYIRRCKDDQEKIRLLFDREKECAELVGGTVPIQDLNDEIMKWAAAEYERSDMYAEKLVCRTMSKIKVRSKSEMIIANALTVNGIPFRYEEALHIGESTYYPDFTIKHPITGMIYYLEHLGLADRPDYMLHNLGKIETYMSEGIIPTRNLICTFETADSPLDSDYVQRIIELYFK